LVLAVAFASFALAEDSIRQAEAALQAGHAKQAETIVRAALAKEDRPDLHRTLADCLEAEGDFKNAAVEYRAAATSDPSEPNLFAFGSELLKYHGYPQAVQVFSYAASHFPSSARIIVGLGIAQYSTGQYDDAVETLCRAVDLDPTDTRALTFLGKMTGVSPKLSANVQVRLKDFANRYPNNPSALYFYALSLPPAQAADARRLLARAVALQLVFADAHYQLGRIYQDQRQTKQAIAEYLLAVSQKPDLKAAHYRLAQLYTQTGQTQLAKQQYELVKSYPAKSAADDK
jgi:tetratricopeptide (TPR) repeat protein